MATVGRTTTSTVGAYAPIAVVGILAALLPLRYGDSRTTMGVIIGGVLFAAYVIGFNIIFGSTGQLFLCVGALAGLGGYTSAILSDDNGVPLVLAMLIASLVAAVVGGALSWIAVSRSLGVIFTGIVTVAFSLAFQNLLLGRRDLTRGETGLVVEAGSTRSSGSRWRPTTPSLCLCSSTWWCTERCKGHVSVGRSAPCATTRLPPSCPESTSSVIAFWPACSDRP